MILFTQVLLIEILEYLNTSRLQKLRLELSVKNKNITPTINSDISTSKISNLVRMLSVKARNISMLLFVPILMDASIFSPPVNGAVPLVEEAKSTVNCREVSDAEDRLACFDVAAKRLADLLNPVKPATDLAEAPSPNPESSTAESPAIVADDGIPTWAAAPQYTKEELAQETRDKFETMIVRITVNKRGSHRFYTEDGAVWKQTQKVKVVPPRSLPAIAELRLKRTGNPTIKFIDISNRSYRVRRVE